MNCQLKIFTAPILKKKESKLQLKIDLPFFFPILPSSKHIILIINQ